MSAVKNQSVTLPDNTVVTRKRSTRVYTHAVAVLNGDGTWGIRNWCGSKDRADYEARAAMTPRDGRNDQAKYADVKVIAVRHV